jgi:hypothetical protein
MATLKFYTIQQQRDHQCFSPIAKTKKELYKMLAEYDLDDFRQDGGVYKIEKMEIEYQNAFDLFDLATDEGGGRYNAGTVAMTYLMTRNMLEERIAYHRRHMTGKKLKLNGDRVYHSLIEA